MATPELPQTYQLIVDYLGGARRDIGRFRQTMRQISGYDEKRVPAAEAAEKAFSYINYAASYFGGDRTREMMESYQRSMQLEDFAAIDPFSPTPNASAGMISRLETAAQMVLDAKAPLVDAASPTRDMVGLKAHHMHVMAMTAVGPWWEYKGREVAHNLTAALANIAIGTEIPFIQLGTGIAEVKAFAADLPKIKGTRQPDRERAKDIFDTLVGEGQSNLRAALKRVKVPAIA